MNNQDFQNNLSVTTFRMAVEALIAVNTLKSLLVRDELNDDYNTLYKIEAQKITDRIKGLLGEEFLQSNQ